jgi:xanthine/uracil/vitamin C permease (AzgA family)
VVEGNRTTDFAMIFFVLVNATVAPNQKSPEPTAVTAAVAIHAASRRWLSFGR